MFVLAKFGFFALLAWNLLGFSTGFLENKTSLCVLTDPREQCDNFCLKLLQPLTNHIELHQNKWADQHAAKQDETQQKLNLIINQLEELQEKVIILNKGLQYQNSTLISLDKQIYISMNFVRVGTRLFYISHKSEVAGSEAEQFCKSKGGFSAVFLNEKELIAIKEVTTKGLNYWTGLNDIVNEKKFVSAATQASDSYMKWGEDLSKQNTREKNCVSLKDGELWVHQCGRKFNYICQLDKF
ncbi:C-type lectin domain family 3 member A-like [Drosophila bipectinata]|uniref:C-type lectin domain family 3 member A-like n=1 Tax=Drosophila bipectinata TaxID=42026 RepID=UPI0038B333A3